MNFKFSFQSLYAQPVMLALSFSAVALVLTAFGWDLQAWAALALVFLSFGISHGAIDHLTDRNITSWKDLTSFIGIYVLKASLLGVLWFLLPDLALLGFILFSAWHFGQTDFMEWKLPLGIPTFLWGTVVIFIILLFHFPETIMVLENIPGLQSVGTLKTLSGDSLLYLQLSVTAVALLLSGWYKSRNMLLTVIYLLLTIALPLLMSFGIYFVFQHSLQGWKHLKHELKLSSPQLLKKAFPYTFATVIFAAVFLFNYSANYLGMSFILLSCISMPHVMSMDYFYRKKA